MRLSRIFVKQPLSEGARLELDSDSSHYLRNVLRLKPGAVVSLFNGDDCNDYHALLSFQGKQAVAVVQSVVTAMTESALSTEIIQGLSRSDRMDFMIQKATELGINRIGVFNARYSQIPLKSTQKDKKLSHWQAVANKACEQSGRLRPPEILFYSSLVELLNQPLQRDIRLLLDLEGEKLNCIPTQPTGRQKVSLMVGPEGGLSEAETKLAIASSFDSVSLGPRVLRTETAAITALAIIQSMWGDI